MIDKVYVTKYALTDGVRLCKVWWPGEWRDAYMYVKVEWPGKPYIGALRLGSDAHINIGDARFTFNDMREKAIKSAEKKLERLRAMKFEVKE